ncbi:MAG: hypothetical protein ABEJ34_07640 [Haloferacaceae archaeon]
MGCPVHNGEESEGNGEDEDDRGIDRRSFMKSALVIGGSSALSTTVGLYGMPETAAAADPPTFADRANRQHAWDAYEAFNEQRGRSVHPPHNLVLHLDYAGSGRPDPAHRRTVERVLSKLERAFQWSHDGLLFTMGYSPGYFEERFGETLPPGLNPDNGPKPGLLRARDLIETDGVTLDREEPVHADEHDAALHLASDHVQNLLAAEEALWGFPGQDRTEVNGVDFAEDNFRGIFEKPTGYPDRKTGHAGHEAVSSRLKEDTDFDTDRLHDDAELSMGFNDLYRNSIPRETAVTMVEGQKLVEPKPPGQFAQGTVEHVSKLDVNLSEKAGDRQGGWYDDHDLDERRSRMFSPHHTDANTGDVGENLGDSNAPGDLPMRDISKTEPTADEGDADFVDADDDDQKDRRLDAAERVQEDAEENRAIGHAQKLARARFDLSDRLTEDAKERLEESGEYPNAAEGPGPDVDGHDGDQEATQVLLRRDAVSTDQDRPGNLFVALMRFNPYMVYIRRAMNGVDFDTSTFGLPTGEGEPGFEHDGSVAREDNGIVHYITTQRRGNFLVPPLTLRALPYPRGLDADLTVQKRNNTYRVTVRDIEEDPTDDIENPVPQGLDLETVRFGWYRTVNRAGGATPVDTGRDGDDFYFEFEAGEASLGDEDKTRARFFGKFERTRRAVFATVDLSAD